MIITTLKTIAVIKLLTSIVINYQFNSFNTVNFLTGIYNTFLNKKKRSHSLLNSKNKSDLTENLTYLL